VKFQEIVYIAGYSTTHEF